MAKEWQTGLSAFEVALEKTTTPQQHANASEDLRIAEAACLYFKSVANQIQFTLARNALLTELPPAEREMKKAAIKAIAADEIQIARRLFILTRQDSRIGFEAANQYFYYPLDLIEKVINCQYILNDWLD